MSSLNIRDKIINQGVINLLEYGYPNVNEENIMTDEIYKKFFLEMLKGNLGLGFDDYVNELIKQLEETK